MITEIIVISQYRENYGTVESPYWKPKGGHTMILKVEDFDFLMYYQEQLVESIKEVLKQKSNSMCTYEYLSHDVVIGGMEDITEKFNPIFQKTMSEMV